jgi:hypothetical protein
VLLPWLAQTVTIDVLNSSPPPLGTRDRIEHCAIALPSLPIDWIAGAQRVNNSDLGSDGTAPPARFCRDYRLIGRAETNGVIA